MAFSNNKNETTIKRNKKSNKKSFGRNVLRSIRLSSADALKELAPNISATLSDNTQYIKQQYNEIKNKVKNSDPGGYVVKNSKNLVKNLVNDLKSGKWYNEEGENLANSEMMKSMGIDFDMSEFDFGDFDNVQSSSSEESYFDEESGNTIKQQNNVFLNMSDNSTTNTAIVESSSAVIKNSANGFSQVSDLLSGILEFHNRNTSSFYNEMSEKMTNLSTSVSRLEKLMAGNAQASLIALKNNEESLKELLDQQTLSLEWMVNNLKKKDTFGTGMGGMLGGMLKGNISKIVNNPLGTLMTFGIKKLLPDNIKKELKGFDKMFGQLPLILNMLGGNMSKGKGLTGFLGKLLSDATGGQGKYDGKVSFGIANKKEATAFDNETKTTINRVIPGLLSKILASVSNDDFYKGELVYDYENGSFLTSSDYIKNSNKKAKKSMVDTDSGIEARQAIASKYKLKTGTDVNINDDKFIKIIEDALKSKDFSEFRSKLESIKDPALKNSALHYFLTDHTRFVTVKNQSILSTREEISRQNEDNALAIARGNDRKNKTSNNISLSEARILEGKELNDKFTVDKSTKYGRVQGSINKLLGKDWSDDDEILENIKSFLHNKNLDLNKIKDLEEKATRFVSSEDKATMESRKKDEKFRKDTQKKNDKRNEENILNSLGSLEADNLIKSTISNVNGQTVINVNTTNIETKLDKIIDCVCNNICPNVNAIKELSGPSSAEGSSALVLTDNGYKSKYEDDSMMKFDEISGGISTLTMTVSEGFNNILTVMGGGVPDSSSDGKYNILDSFKSKIKGFKSKFSGIGGKFGRIYKSFTGKISEKFKKFKDKFGLDWADREQNEADAEAKRKERQSRTSAFSEKISEMWNSIKSGDFLSKIPIIGGLFKDGNALSGLGGKIGNALSSAGKWALDTTKAVGKKGLELGKKGLSWAGDKLSGLGKEGGFLSKVGDKLSGLGKEGGFLDKAKSKVSGLFGKKGKGGNVDLSFIPKGVTPVWIVGSGHKSFIEGNDGGNDITPNSGNPKNKSSGGGSIRGFFGKTKDFLKRDGGIAGHLADFNKNRKEYGLGNAFKLEKSKFQGKSNKEIGGQKSQMKVKNKLSGADDKLKEKAARSEEKAQAIHNAKERLKESAHNAAMRAKEMAVKAKDWALESATKAKDWALDSAHKAKERISDSAHKASMRAKEMAVNIKDWALDSAQKLKDRIKASITKSVTEKTKAGMELTNTAKDIALESGMRQATNVSNNIFKSVVEKMKGGMEVLAGGIKAAATAIQAAPGVGQVAAIIMGIVGAAAVGALAAGALASVGSAKVSKNGTLGAPKSSGGGKVPKAKTKEAEKKKKEEEKKNKQESEIDKENEKKRLNLLSLLKKENSESSLEGRNEYMDYTPASETEGDNKNPLLKLLSSLFSRKKSNNTVRNQQKGSIKKVLMIGPKIGLAAGLIIDGKSSSSNSANKSALNQMGREYAGAISKNGDVSNSSNSGAIKTKNQELGSMSSEDFFNKLFCILYHQGQHSGISASESSHSHNNSNQGSSTVTTNSINDPSYNSSTTETTSSSTSSSQPIKTDMNGSSSSDDKSTIKRNPNSSSTVNFGGGWQRLVGNLKSLYISSPFGSKESFRTKPHNGIDITGAVNNQPFYAAEGGTVIEAKNSGYNYGYGNTVLIEHADGTRTRYGHASRVAVKKGDIVQKGQYLGNVGSTGNSTGPHLHFGLKDKNGNDIDPMPLLSGAGSSQVFNNGVLSANSGNNYNSNGSCLICSSNDIFSESKITLSDADKREALNTAFQNSKKAVEKVLGAKLENEALDETYNPSASQSNNPVLGNPSLSSPSGSSYIQSNNPSTPNIIVSGDSSTISKNIINNGGNSTVKVEVSCADAKRNHYDYEKYSTLQEILKTCRKLGDNTDSMVNYLKKILEELKKQPVEKETNSEDKKERERFNLDSTGLELIFKGF